MATKRTGNGGNTSRNARNNLVAHDAYIEKFGKSTKSCTGFLHHDAGEVDVRTFRQATNNKSTGLQGRCDLCNRLYFSLLQKPKVRIIAIGIYAKANGINSVLETCPKTIAVALNRAVDHYFSTKCKVKDCPYTQPHGDFRDAVEVFTKAVSGLEKGPRNSTVLDEESSISYPAPEFLHDMQNWAGKGGALYKLVDVKDCWNWWVDSFPVDKALCTQEVNEEKKDPDFKGIEHPLSDFPWGAGNIKETISGHTVPGFNQVRSAASVLPSSSNIGNRPYGYLCEGDHLAMARFSRECKKEGLSLGHTPAPLRWFGKNDPINAKKEPLKENVAKRDSLIELFKIAVESPDHATNFVSWQVKDKVAALGKQKVSFERFTMELEAEVEHYLDMLLETLKSDSGTRILTDLKKADPGKTETVYQYRLEKLRKFLESRPTSRKVKSKKQV